MAVQDSENPSSPGARLSPGDAAFARLKQREALKVRDESASPPSIPEAVPAAFIGPVVDPATIAASPAASAGSPAKPPVPPVAALTATPAASPTPMLAAPDASRRLEAEQPVDRVLAMAAAFGIEAAAPAPTSETPDTIEGAAPATLPDIPDPAPAPAFVAPPISVPPLAEGRSKPPLSSVDATADRLEAALLDQLRSLEETLVEDAPRAPPRLPRAQPLRPATRAQRTSAPDGPPQRSVFAPDPVRQRTYVDLRTPAPATEKTASDDPPWRKYLVEPHRRQTAGRAAPHRPASPPAGRPSPVAARAYDRKVEVEDRGRGIRAMTAAAVLGLGVGLGVLVLVRPFVDSGSLPVAASVSESGGPVVAASPASESGTATTPRVATHVNQALATLLADPPVSRAAPGQPAVISEPGTQSPEPVVVSVAEPVEPVAPSAPPVIRPPPGEARSVARAPDFEVAQPGPLAYGPAIPSYDPVRQQLLEQEAEGQPAAGPRTQVAARAPAETQSAPAPVRPGRATINDFVNLRAKPDNAAPVVAILAEGLAIKVIACDYWCEIEAGGKRGFVFKKFVSR